MTDFDDHKWKHSGAASTMVSILAYRPSCPGFDSQHSVNGINVDVAVFNQRHCFKESGQWLENSSSAG